jgi:hypothetical protein
VRTWWRALTPHDRIAVWLVAAGLSIRVLLTASARAEPARLQQPDSEGYLRLAADLAAYRGTDGPLLELSLRRPPGYPVLLNLLIEGLGLGIVGAMVVQAIMVSSSIGLIYVLGRRLASPRVGLFAAAVVAFEPSVVAQAPVVLTEGIFTTLLLAALILLVPARPGRAPTPALAAVSGGLLGVATLVRPVGLLLPPLIAIAMIVVRSGRARQRAVAAVLLVVTSTTIVAGWALHNGSRAGLTTVSSITAVQLLEYRAAGLAALEAPDSTFLDRLIGTRDDRAEVRRLQGVVTERIGDEQSVVALYHARTELAIELLRDDPIGTAQVVAEGLAANLLRPALTGRTQWQIIGVERDPTDRPAWLLALAAVEVLALAVFYGLVLLGLGVLLRRGRFGEALLLILPASALLVLSSGLESYSRFRGPSIPMLAIVAGIGMHWFAARSDDAHLGAHAR